MIAGMTYYELLWYFFIYAFAGWVIEVAYHAVTLGKIVNRGFLNGPICPVYGFGMLSVLAMTHLLDPSVSLKVKTGIPEVPETLLIFLDGIILATAVELLAGWLLDVLFHTRWWDYSKEPFNLHGYICLKFSIIWGLAITFVILIVQPQMESRSLSNIPEQYGWPILIVCSALFAADLILTVATIIGLNKRLKELDRMRSSMRVISDKLSEGIAAPTIKTAQAIGEGQVQAALARAELKDVISERTEKTKEALQEKREETQKRLEDRKQSLQDTFSSLKTSQEALSRNLLGHGMFSAKRILRAFPQMHHRDYDDLLEEYREDRFPEDKETRDL